jgi:hypothetical protein
MTICEASQKKTETKEGLEACHQQDLEGTPAGKSQFYLLYKSTKVQILTLTRLPGNSERS